MAGLILGHFMYSVMDSIQAQLLSFGSQFQLAGACAVFSLSAHLNVGFGAISHNLTQQLSKFGSMFSFLKSVKLKSAEIGRASCRERV